MNSFYESRLIKIVSPINDEVFTIELGGDEKELRELIATIINIPTNCVKGIRDSYGNYYTLSSAIRNTHLNSEFSSFYFIVIRNENNDNNNNLLNSDKIQNKIQKNSNYNSNNNNMFNMNTNSINSKDSVSSFSKFNFPNNNNNNNNNINKNNLLINNDNLNNYNNSNSNNYNDDNNYIQIAKKMLEKKYIDSLNFNKLKQMLMVENEEIITLFKLYLTYGKDLKKLSLQILPILEMGGLDSPRKTNLYKSKNKEMNMNQNLDSNYNINNKDFLEEIKDEIKDKNDLALLEKLISFENEDILEAINVYYNTKNKENLFQTIDNLLKKFRGRLSVPKVEIDNNDEETKLNKKNEKYAKKINKFLLENNLNFDIIIMFKYDMLTMDNYSKSNLFKNMFKIKDVNNITAENKKLIKDYYLNEISYKLLSNLKKKDISLYNEIIDKHDENIYNCFNKLLEHKDIYILKNEITNYIKQIKKKKEEEEEEVSNSNNNNNEEDEENEDEEEEDEEEEESENDTGNDSEDEDSYNNNNKKNSSEKSSYDNNNNDNNKSNEFIINKKEKSDFKLQLNRYVNNQKNEEEKNNNNNNNDEDDDNNNDDENDDENGLGLINLKQASNNEESEEENSEQSEKRKNKSNTNFTALANLHINKSSNKKFNEFIKVINAMALKENEKKKIMDLLSENNEKIQKIFEKFQKNKMSLTKKILINCINTENVNSNNNNNNNNKNNNNNNLLKAKDPKFEEELKKLLSSKKINEKTFYFLITQFNNGVNMINSIWESYLSDPDEDFEESIFMYLEKKKKEIDNFVIPKSNENGNVTPISIKNYKKELINDIKEKKKLKDKLKNIIDLLYQEKIIEKIPKDFYYNKIKNNDSNLFAAFQVFSVTKNHLDFAETLKTIYNNEINGNNNNNSNNNNSNNNNNNKDDGKNKLKKLLDEILLDKQFTDGEREIAIEEFNEQNNMLLSILQSHDPDEYEDTVSGIKMICEKSIKKNSRKL